MPLFWILESNEIINEFIEIVDQHYEIIFAIVLTDKFKFNKLLVLVQFWELCKTPDWKENEKWNYYYMLYNTDDNC